VLNKKIQDINPRLNKLLRKELVWLAQQTGVSALSAGPASKLLHLHAYKAIVVNENNNNLRTASVKFSKLFSWIPFRCVIELIIQSASKRSLQP
jgi:hypothetical protein